ncbi:MAG TPA: hypothetical protein VFP37_05120 [Steroidobacteraceae bacterium]|nr:hypothetical protein [Steroidobacteraceae bacterium]
MKSTDYLHLAVLAAIALAVAACSSSGDRPASPPPPMNSAPAVSQIGDQSTDQDTTIAIDFGVDDRESGADALTISAAVDGSTLFPEDGVVLSGSGTTRSLTLTPLEAATGTASVVVRVADPEGLATTRTFNVAVNARPNSIRSMALETFAKSETDEATVINGWTIQQDADDPGTFAALIPAEEP